MKLQIASDLHHELESGRAASVIEPASDAEVLVLAGDIANGTDAVSLYADYKIPVIYVHGNHEPYDCVYPALVDELREKAKGTSVHFLQDEMLALGGVRFLGACMWTDYFLYPLDFADAMKTAGMSMLDHQKIRRADRRFFQPEDARQHQRKTLRWLNERLNEPFSGKTVVITHHAPSGMSVPHAKREHSLAAAYATNVERLAVKADFWIHGHIHFTSDYSIGKCRVLCNPRGRPGRNRTRPDLFYENAQFNPELVIEI
ncbi:putative phosphodiesterase [Paraburkholderia sp. GAS199]|uniref:metallophosphoesterase n=1 Tax=Paraburkholderia sp. GAS199 TaxID=3035126 RepID=UPI003D1C6002